MDFQRHVSIPLLEIMTRRAFGLSIIHVRNARPSVRPMSRKMEEYPGEFTPHPAGNILRSVKSENSFKG